jgi:FeS assembly SUF system protein
MSSPPSEGRADSGVVPLDDAPPPRSADQDPLNTLKFQPLIVEALSKVYDPEIPVNIYELGLVYEILVDNAANATIRMTLTAPACPAAQTIPQDVERRVKEVPGIGDVKVEIVWDPPWSRERMSEAAKLTLGLF